MTTDEKELWLVQHGSIDTYGRSESEAPHVVWTSWNRMHTIRAQFSGMGDEAIDRLYRDVKNTLYSIVQHITQ